MQTSSSLLMTSPEASSCMTVAIALRRASRENTVVDRPPAVPSDGQWAATRGVLFDMGDVLFDATAWRRWLLGLLSRLGIHSQYRPLFHVWEVDFLDEVHRGERNYLEAFRDFLGAIGLSRGQIDEVCAASQARKRAIETTVRPLPGVRSTLAELQRQGYVLGVLSDSESTAAQIRRRLDSIDLGRPFSTIVSSRDLARTKPDPLTYATALAQMDVAADETLFVGHDQVELRGAARAGMRTVAFNNDRAVVADVAIERFDQLHSVVECGQPAPPSPPSD
ncbi:MAG: HAD family hydrolase [Pirellulales bacterium]